MNRYRVNRKLSHAGVLTLGLLSLCMLCNTNPKTTSESIHQTTGIATESPYAGVMLITSSYLSEQSPIDTTSANILPVGSADESDESSDEDPSSEPMTEEVSPQEDNEEIPQDDISEEVTTDKSEVSEVTTQVTEEVANTSSEEQLNSCNGRVEGPSGSETYYNLNMNNCVRRMQEDMGYDYEYWIRDDGVKMFGPYVMIAADFSSRPLGTVLETSLGTAIVVDTGDFAETDPTGIDIAVTW